MTTDATIQRAIDDAHLDSEMEKLMANRPSYRESLPGTNNQLEPLSSRALDSTAAEMPMWNRETGLESTVIFDALRARLRQRFPADHPNPKFRGAKVYTLHPTGCNCGEPDCDPAPRVVRGTLACPLSLASEDREEVEALGFGAVICPKPAIFASARAVERHVEKSHKDFYEVREKAIEDAEKQADRERQEMMLRAMERLAGAETPKRTRKAEE